MNQKEICQLWIEYLKESSFRKKKGDTIYRDYINRIEKISKSRQLTPWPTVRPISDVIERFIDLSYSEAFTDSGKEPSFNAVKKKLIRAIKLREETALLLFIHCAGIPPRGGMTTVLKEIRKLISDKLKAAAPESDFYQTWSEPGDRVASEVALYLQLYRGKKKNLTLGKLQAIATAFYVPKEENNRLNKKGEDAYSDQSQIRRGIMYAKRIMKNVEKGNFPGNYK